MDIFVADIADKQLKTLKKLIETAEANLAGARQLLSELLTDEEDDDPTREPISGERVIEGYFNGEKMIDDTGKPWTVQANYASKSKLVQGDGLKLTISDNGHFTYKQIAPVQRRKLIGTLSLKNGQYYVEAQGHDYHVLFPSVTYYKAQPGDQVTIIIPEEGPADWAAIEAVLA
jgi:hypothetical protein